MYNQTTINTTLGVKQMTNTLNAPEEFFQSVDEKATPLQKQDACGLVIDQAKAMTRMAIDRIELEPETIDPLQICNYFEALMVMINRLEVISQHPIEQSK